MLRGHFPPIVAANLSQSSSVNQLPRTASTALASVPRAASNVSTTQNAQAHGQRRPYVQPALQKQLIAIARPAVVLPKMTPPYQRSENGEGSCEDHAIEVLRNVNKQAPVKLGVLDMDGGLPFLLRAAGESREQLFHIIKFNESTDLLAAYKRGGAFILRAPGLSKTYWSHAVVVTAVVEAVITNKNWEKEVRQVLCCLDGDDSSKDTRTSAARKEAEEKGLQLSDLTVEEADKHGGHLQRFRMIDSKLLGRHSDFFQRPDIDIPYAAFARTGSGRLTDEQLEKLGEKIGKVYHTYAVEKEFDTF